jgi:shikimate dehydrogenase (EC 1.1.1.25)
VSVDGVDAVVVGAGGAGRAVTAALAESAASVHVANRTVGRATELVEGFRTAFAATNDETGRAPATLSAGGLDSLSETVPGADVLVNATSVGMESDETPVPAELLHADLAVLDAVYTPLETRLLRDAAAVGAETVDGAWMLLFQGVEAFELWTGHEAPVPAMNEALRAGLAE